MVRQARAETGSPLATLGRFAAALDPARVPPPVLGAARLEVADMVAAALAGARSRETACILAALGGFAAPAGAAGGATVLASGERRGPADAALANAAHAMAHDFDDIVWMGHTCFSAVFAPLAVAEREGADARAFLAGVIAANEVAGRIGASCCLGPLNGQMWTFIHLVGAAAGAARVLGLDAERTTHALAIALAQPNFALQPGFMAPTSKLLAAATPTATGIQAAYFARAGMTGAPAILEDRRGFWRRFSFVPLQGMLGGLGEFWTLLTLTVKTYPGCHYFQTACTAIERLLARNAGREVRDVRIETTKVACEVARFAAGYAGGEGTISAVNACFDLRTAAAILLCAGRLTSAEMEPGWLAANADAIRSLRARVHVAHDPALTGRLIASARAVGAGRAALASLGLRDLALLWRRYAEEYGSSLLSARDALGLVRAGLRALFDGGTGAAAPCGPGEPIPLYFPARVEVRFADGALDAERVDLPVASLAAPGHEREIETKFRREAAPSLGDERAREAWHAILAGEGETTADLVRRVIPRPDGP